MSANALPIVAAIGAFGAAGLFAVYFGGSPAQSAPSTKQAKLQKRTSEIPRTAELAWNSNEGAAIRSRAQAEGHSGNGTMGSQHK